MLQYPKAKIPYSTCSLEFLYYFVITFRSRLVVHMFCKYPNVQMKYECKAICSFVNVSSVMAQRTMAH